MRALVALIVGLLIAIGVVVWQKRWTPVDRHAAGEIERAKER